MDIPEPQPEYKVQDNLKSGQVPPPTKKDLIIDLTELSKEQSEADYQVRSSQWTVMIHQSFQLTRLAEIPSKKNYHRRASTGKGYF